MQNELIQKVATLMADQTTAYNRLQSAAKQLSAALVQGEPDTIESLSRAGETELMRMRARLLEMISALTEFSEMRAAETEKAPLDKMIREQFDTSAKQLLEAAGSFQAVASRCTSLALGGSAFSSACLQVCGVPPSTYRAPVLKYAEGAFVR
jgi:hypothetical protein